MCSFKRLRNHCRSIAPLAIAMLLGCSTDNVKLQHVKTEAIHQIYDVTYDAERDTTHQSARLRVGGPTGTNLELTGNSSIVCNGLRLAESNFFGKCYDATVAGVAPRNQFAFTDIEGKTFRNSIDLEPVDFDAATPKKLSRAMRYNMPFAGAPARAGESVMLTVLQVPQLGGPGAANPAANLKQPGAGAPVAKTAAVGTTHVALEPRDLARLTNGPAVLQWVRVVNGQIQDATPAGGSIHATYRTPARPVDLTD